MNAVECFEMLYFLSLVQWKLMRIELFTELYYGTMMCVCVCVCVCLTCSLLTVSDVLVIEVPLVVFGRACY